MLLAHSRESHLGPSREQVVVTAGGGPAKKAGCATRSTFGIASPGIASHASGVGFFEKVGALFRTRPDPGEAQVVGTPDLLLDAYESDIHRQGLVTLGKEYKPEDVKRFREEARNGDPRKLYELFDEMVRLGPGPQKTKAVEAMKGASVQFVTFPEQFDDDEAVPTEADPAAVSAARTARDFVRDTFSERLADLIEIHADQHFYGIADSRIRLAPRGNGGRWESIEDITPIPARRHRLDPVTREWMLMRSPDAYNGIPVSSVTLRADRGLEGVFFTEIGGGSVHLDQRGLLVQCLVPWGIQQFVVRWRAKYIELFGIPPRIGFTDFSDPKRVAEMKDMLRTMGSTAYGVFHRSPSGQETDVKLLEAKTSSGSSDPFAAQLEWCDLLYSMVILGHSQAASVQKGTGSKVPAETAQEQFQNIINSRLRTFAGQLRRGLVRTMVARNLGQAVADRHLPIVKLTYADRDQPEMLSNIALTLQKAGLGEMIAAEDVVRRCTLRVAKAGEKSAASLGSQSRIEPKDLPAPGDGEKALTTKPPTPDPAVVDRTNSPAGAGVGQTLKAARTPARKTDRLEKFAEGLADGAGEEITAPARRLIDRAVAEAWPPNRLLAELVRLQNAPTPTPQLEDRLAAAWTEGIGTGVQEIRDARARRAQ